MIKVIQPSVLLMTEINYGFMLYSIELAGRTCYKSEDGIGKDSSERFVRMLIKSGHESVLEHKSITVRFICDRSTSHQLVRHRIGSYSQESQRYCNYNKNEELEVICPPSIFENSTLYARWLQSMNQIYEDYKFFIFHKIKPEDARSVLQNAAKTEVVTTYNIRQWRHVIKERALNKRAQWQIRYLMNQVLDMFVEKMPVLFEDLKEK